MSELEVAAELLKAFAHPLRLAIVLEVGDGERFVRDVLTALGGRPTAGLAAPQGPA